MNQIASILELRSTARELFAAGLGGVDAGRKLREVVRLEGSRLRFGDCDYDVREPTTIYSIATGKAAHAMATALTGVLGDKLTAGVVSAPRENVSLPDSWRVFAGGHPVPNEASFEAARFSIELLQKANSERALVIFLISGGGSAMMELPRDERITLQDLQTMNRVLVGCGATIAEINTVRRALSAIKGGGLSGFAARARQVTLIVSDTNKGDEASVASGLTMALASRSAEVARARFVVAHYNLPERLPKSVLHALDDAATLNDAARDLTDDNEGEHKHLVLLDNESALESVEKIARERGFVVEVARDLVEQPIAEGCTQLVKRLADLEWRLGGGNIGCLISGGEFACPVRASGEGGRNAEAALRCAIEMHEMRARTSMSDSLAPRMVALHAGTDGIDGNSSAAGAIADDTTLERAAASGLDARDYLERSDAYSFFDRLGDTIMTGTTGTNVRDLRIMLVKNIKQSF